MAVSDGRTVPTRVASALFVGVVLIHLEQLRDGYRAPKQWLLELGALLVCAVLLLAARTAPGPDALRAQRYALRLWLPLLMVGAVSLVGSIEASDTWRALWSLWIFGLLLFFGTRFRLSFETVLNWAQVAGVLVAVWALFDFMTPAASVVPTGGARLRVQSSLGNPFDTALVLLPTCLLAQARLRWQKSTGARRGMMVAASIVTATGVLVTATLSAVGGLVLATMVLWWPSKVSFRRAAGAALLAAAALFAVVASPLADRVGSKTAQLRRGDFNAVLTGRLDGWRVAAEQFRRAPVFGNGFGTYGRGFNEVKEALLQRGVEFYELHGRRSSFANAHNEFLEVAAGAGLFGVALVCWWLIEILRRILQLRDGDRRLAWALLIAATASATFYFPFRLAAPGLLWLMILGWLLQGASGAEARREESTGEEQAPEALSRRQRLAGVALVLASFLASGQQVLAEWRAERALSIAEARAGQFDDGAWGAQERERWRGILDALERAHRGREHDARLSMAIGTYWVLGEQPERAREWYRRSLDEEIRPETLANLARTLRSLGEIEAARSYEQRAARLDRFWRRRFGEEGVR